MTLEEDAFVFDGRTYSRRGRRDPARRPGASGEIVVLGVSAARRPRARAAPAPRPRRRPADYAVTLGRAAQVGTVRRASGRAARDRPRLRPRPDRASATSSSRGSGARSAAASSGSTLRAQAAAAARWEKVAARFAGKKPSRPRLSGRRRPRRSTRDPPRPADLVVEDGAIRVDLDASAPAEPDLVTPVLAAAGARARPIPRCSSVRRSCSRRRARGASAGGGGATCAASPPSRAPRASSRRSRRSSASRPGRLARARVGAAAAWLDAGARLESEARGRQGARRGADAALVGHALAMARGRAGGRASSLRRAGLCPRASCAASPYLAHRDRSRARYVSPLALERSRASPRLGVNSIALVSDGYARTPPATGSSSCTAARAARPTRGWCAPFGDARRLGHDGDGQAAALGRRRRRRGDIAMPDERGWRAWFDVYRRFIVHQAVVAEAAGATLFCVGTEAPRRPRRAKNEWKQAIVRRAAGDRGRRCCTRPPGGRGRRHPFWDVLDAIGVDFFDPLARAEKADRRRADERSPRGGPIADAAERRGQARHLHRGRAIRGPARRGRRRRDASSARRRRAEDAARTIAARLPGAGAESPGGRASTGGEVFSDGAHGGPGERGFNLLGTPAEKAIEGFRQREARSRERRSSTRPSTRPWPAASVLLANWRNLPHGSVEEKKKNDFVTHADRESEERIVARSARPVPEDAFLGEEGGPREGAGRRRARVDHRPARRDVQLRLGLSVLVRLDRGARGRRARRRRSCGTRCATRCTRPSGAAARGATARASR